MKLPSAYILSHTGMGDNVAMIGCAHFLANFYEDIYFLCVDIYCEQLSYALKEFPFIRIVSFPSYPHAVVPSKPNLEGLYAYFKDFLSSKYETSDIFTCGNFKFCLDCKITHPYLLNPSLFRQDFPEGFSSFMREPYRNIFKNIDNFYDYTYKGVNILPSTFDFIDMFYKDTNLNTNICFDFFYINIDEDIVELYNRISNYDIIFIHSSSATTNDIHLINNYLKPYLENEQFMVICANHNYYHDNIGSKKYETANQYILLPTIFHYVEIIKNSAMLIMTDSCISCLSLPFIKKGHVKTRNIHIYHRASLQETNLDILYR